MRFEPKYNKHFKISKVDFALSFYYSKKRKSLINIIISENYSGIYLEKLNEIDGNEK
jgi:hypothetical protein